MSDPSFTTRLVYYPMDVDDWRQLHGARDLAGPLVADVITSVLDRIQERAMEHFAMVVWAEEDVLYAVAQAQGTDVHPADLASYADARVSVRDVQAIIRRCEPVMLDWLTQQGWGILEDATSSYLADTSPDTSPPSN
jgi:hypothetical protein